MSAASGLRKQNLYSHPEAIDALVQSLRNEKDE